MKIIRFRATKRRAELLDTKYEDIVKHATSFANPGARYSANFIPSKKVREELAAKGYRVWDGRKNMLINSRLSIGLLRAKEVREELKNKGFEIKLTKWKDRPSYATARGFEDKGEKYKFQNNCVQAMLRSISFGGGLVLSATATGKTKIAAQFSSWIKDSILFVVDQKDLLYQNAKEIESWLKEPVGVVGDSKFMPSDHVTVATIQTLHKHRKNPLFKRWLKQVKIVIIDELHVQMGRRNFSVISTIKPEAVFGLTATLELKKKPVRMRAYSIAGPVIFTYPVEQGMKEGVLTKGVAIQVQVKCSDTNYVPAAVKNKKLNNRVVEFISHAINKGYYCVALTERIAHLKRLEKLFQGNGIDPAMCYGAVGVRQRQRIRKKFEDGKEHLIIANVVFKKGINLKRVDLIVDLAQRSNKNDVLQKIGRGLRLHTDKIGLMYFDFASIPGLEEPSKKRFNALKKAKIPVVRVPCFKEGNAESLLILGEGLLHKFIKKKRGTR